MMKRIVYVDYKNRFSRSGETDIGVDVAAKEMDYHGDIVQEMRSKSIIIIGLENAGSMSYKNIRI